MCVVLEKFLDFRYRQNNGTLLPLRILKHDCTMNSKMFLSTIKIYSYKNHQTER